MNLSTSRKKEIIVKYSGSERNTGATEVQIALLTERVKYISNHLSKHKKDFSTLRGLDKLVNQRKRLLAYLQRQDINRYRAIIKELDLRK